MLVAFSRFLITDPFYFELCQLTLVYPFLGCIFEYLPLSLLQVCGVSLTRFKEFKVLWPCYFSSPSPKFPDTFWRVWGVIDGFNQFLRKIYFGVENTLDQSMSYIRFWANPKGDIPHYSHIFKNPDPLGVDLNNAVCYRLGTVLYLDIHKVRQSIKIQKFQQEIGGTTACMKIIMGGKKGCSKLFSDDAYFQGIQFSVVKTSKQVIAKILDYCGPVNMSHKLFCLATFKNLMEEWLGGSYLVMKITPIVTGYIPPMAISYK